MKHLLTTLTLLLIAPAIAHAGTFACLPSQLGGTGTRAAWGAQISPPQAWVGWWCSGRQQVIACVSDGCAKALNPIAAFEQSNRRTLKGANTLLATLETTNINDPSLRAVWEPHRAEIEAMN